jgi:hypothetical protein
MRRGKLWSRLRRMPSEEFSDAPRARSILNTRSAREPVPTENAAECVQTQSRSRSHLMIFKASSSFKSYLPPSDASASSTSHRPSSRSMYAPADTT